MGDLSPEVKRPGHEVNNAWSYTSTLQYVFMTWSLINERYICTLPLPLPNEPPGHTVAYRLNVHLFAKFHCSGLHWVGVPPASKIQRPLS